MRNFEIVQRILQIVQIGKSRATSLTCGVVISSKKISEFSNKLSATIRGRWRHSKGGVGTVMTINPFQR